MSKQIKEELKKIGITNVHIDPKGGMSGTVVGIANIRYAIKHIGEPTTTNARGIPYRIGQRKIGSTLSMISKSRVV